CDGDLGFPACGHLLRGTLEPAGILEQGTRPAIQHLTGRCQHRITTLHFERLDLQHRLQFLDGIGYGGLALAERLSCLCVAPVVDDGNEATPLLQGDSRRRESAQRGLLSSHLSNLSMGGSEFLYFSIYYSNGI